MAAIPICPLMSAGNSIEISLKKIMGSELNKIIKDHKFDYKYYSIKIAKNQLSVGIYENNYSK